jgi:hypothetical protein
LRYELYIRMPEFADRLPPERAIAELGQAAFVPADVLPSELDLGQGKLLVEAFIHPDRAAQAAEGESSLDGLNLGFDMGIDRDQGERAIGLTFDLADKLGAEVFDPQLGKMFNRSDQNRIVTAWRQSYAFQAGVVGAVGLGGGDPISIEAPPGLLTPQIKLILILGVIILALVFVARSCFSSWLDEKFEVPAQVPSGQFQPMP